MTFVLPYRLTPDQDQKNIVNGTQQNFEAVTTALNTNSLKVVRIVTGSYAFTATDISNGYVNLSFSHTLGFTPLVMGSVTNSSDGSIKMLPALYYVTNVSYYTDPGGRNNYSLIDIQKIDTNNIFISIKIADIGGVSIFLLAGTVSFRLYCLQETAG